MKALNLAALAAALFLFPVTSAQAFDRIGIYFTPKLMYSYQTAKSELSASGPNLNGAWSNDGQSKGKVSGALALGYDFFQTDDVPMRVELEYTWRGKSDFLDGTDNYLGVSVAQKANLAADSIFVNAFYDFHNSSSVTPYLGAGLGMARLNGHFDVNIDAGGNQIATSARQTDWNFAWNVGAGVSFQLQERFSLDLGYRYGDFGQVSGNFSELSGVPGGWNGNSVNVKADLTAHEFLLGFRMRLF